MMYFLSFCLIFKLQASENFNSLMEAQSLEELVRADKEIQIKSELRERCEVESQQDGFPQNCYKKLGEDLKKPQSMTNLEEEREGLDEKCVQFAKKLRRIEVIELHLQQLGLSEKCQKALRQQVLDLKYSQGIEVGTVLENTIKP